MDQRIKTEGKGRADVVLSWDNRFKVICSGDTIIFRKEDSGFIISGYEIYENTKNGKCDPNS